MKKVLFIPELRRNVFSIGLASKSGLSFRTMRDRCELYHDLGRGPKVMEGIRTNTLYKLSINPLVPINHHPHVDDNNDSSVALVTDRGKEFCNDKFELLLEQEGISRGSSIAFTPQQNDYVEHDNWMICEACQEHASSSWHSTLTLGKIYSHYCLSPESDD